MDVPQQALMTAVATEPRPDAEHGLRSAEVAREFEPDPAAVSRVRRFLREVMGELVGPSVGDELADALVMAANELATNAVLHARTEFTVRVVVDAVAVRVEVTDGNSRLPQPCLAPADATSGRGLALIDGSGLDWGIDRHSGGKTIWLLGRRSPTACPQT